MEEYFGFAHGMSAGVAATTVWESLRCFLDGWPLLLVGAGVSWVIIHGVAWHHKRVRRRIRHRAVHGTSTH